MPLRFPRPMVIPAAIGLLMAWIALGSAPAFADQVRQEEWWLTKLHVAQAWHTSEGAGVTIALLDTGVDPSQPDLTGSVITGPDYTKSGRTAGGPFFGIHGTAMASLIVGHGHGPGDASGVVGVAPAARLLSVRVTLDGSDPLLSDAGITAGLPGAIASGIRYAVSNGAQVIDLPLDPGQSDSDLVASATRPPAPVPGAPPSPAAAAQAAAAGGSAAEQSAVDYALSKGVILVAPAGDNGAGTDAVNFPAGYPGVIAVGAFDSSFVKAPFSSHQPYVTLTAPGSGLIAAIPPSGYAPVSSTTAASAIVTGIVALIKSQYPELTPAQVTAALTSSTMFRPTGGTADGSGHGTADAGRALAAAALIAAPGPLRAGASAVPRSLPAAPTVPFVNRGLASKVKRDALVSLVVLALLLVLVLTYAFTRRRAAPAKVPAHSGSEPPPRPAVRTPSAHGASSHADQMLQYFAAVPEPESAGSRPADIPTLGSRGGSRPPAGAGGRPARARGGSGYARSGGLGGSGDYADFDPLAAEDTSRRTGGPQRPSLGPTTRPNAIHPPKVSGSPPWEPARKPETELPWVTSQPPTLARRSPIQKLPTPVPSPVWEAEAESEQAPTPEPGTYASLDHHSPSQPIYVWNPTAKTEVFPAVRDAEADSPASADRPGPPAYPGRSDLSAPASRPSPFYPSSSDFSSPSHQAPYPDLSAPSGTSSPSRQAPYPDFSAPASSSVRRAHPGPSDFSSPSSRSAPPFYPGTSDFSSPSSRSAAPAYPGPSDFSSPSSRHASSDHPSLPGRHASSDVPDLPRRHGPSDAGGRSGRHAQPDFPGPPDDHTGLTD